MIVIDVAHQIDHVAGVHVLRDVVRGIVDCMTLHRK